MTLKNTELSATFLTLSWSHSCTVITGLQAHRPEQMWQYGGWASSQNTGVPFQGATSTPSVVIVAKVARFPPNTTRTQAHHGQPGNTGSVWDLMWARLRWAYCRPETPALCDSHAMLMEDITGRKRRGQEQWQYSIRSRLENWKI